MSKYGRQLKFLLINDNLTETIVWIMYKAYNVYKKLESSFTMLVQNADGVFFSL